MSGAANAVNPMFQSTPPRGGRLRAASSANTFFVFQSTPPRGGRHNASLQASALSSFNPRPRAGGDAWEERSFTQELVSIHAPARGATSCPEPLMRSTPCFNPRPRAGGDFVLPVQPILFLCFNPRPRAGGDIMPHCRRQPFPVSIHAPARGATHGKSGHLLRN